MSACQLVLQIACSTDHHAERHCMPQTQSHIMHHMHMPQLMKPRSARALQHRSQKSALILEAPLHKQTLLKPLARAASASPNKSFANLHVKMRHVHACTSSLQRHATQMRHVHACTSSLQHHAKKHNAHTSNFGSGGPAAGSCRTSVAEEK